MAMKGLIADIYRCSDRSDCSNRGISSRCNQVVIVGLGEDSEIFEATEDRPAVKVVKRSIGCKEVVHVEPVEPPGEAYIGWMHGGTYVATCDSRVSRAVNMYGAVALHDRRER